MYMYVIVRMLFCPDRLIEQGLMSAPTQYRLSGRQFYSSKDPTNSIKVTLDRRQTDGRTITL